jgi:hypothetical protein
MARTGPNFKQYLESVTITSAGSNYSSVNPPTVFISAPTANNTGQLLLQATATVAISGGAVETISIIETGDGYNVTPTVKLIGTLSTASFTAQADSGRSTGTFTGVTQTSSTGTGTGAQFRVVVNASGEVTGVTVTTAGTGYAEGDTITIQDTSLSGDGSAADVVLTAATISGGSGAVLTPSIFLLNRPQIHFNHNFSDIAKYQIPEWIRDDYPKFSNFINKYFEFLDAPLDVTTAVGASTESPTRVMQELLERFGVPHHHYLEALLQQYALDFPENKTIDTRLLIKRIRDFYTSKGSSESIKTFFRMMYGEEVAVFKPSEYVLRPSDGIWSEQLAIKVVENEERSIAYNPLDLQSRKIDIHYYESTASITVRKKLTTAITQAKKIAFTNPSTYELDLDLTANTVIPGTGVLGELTAVIGGKIATVGTIGAANALRTAGTYDINTGFTTSGNGTGAQFTVVVNGSGAATITVDTVGIDYAPGETITIPDAILGGGGGAALTFNVATITEGKIKSVTIADAGQGYSANPDVIVLPNASDTITTTAVMGTRLTSHAISSIVISEDGLGYNTAPTLVLDTTPYRTYISFVNDTLDQIENKRAFLVRVLNATVRKSTSAGANGGFKVGQVFKVAEAGNVLGEYAIDYFSEDYTLTGIDNNAYIRIKTIDASNYPLTFDIIATGVSFQRQSFDFQANSGNGQSVIITCTTGFAHTFPGQFKNSQGFLSDANRLQDNKVYQSYSYQIQSSQPKGVWGEILDRIANPAGMVAFSDLQILHDVNVGLSFNIRPTAYALYLTIVDTPVTSELVILSFSRPVADTFATQDDEAILEPGLVKSENPEMTDTDIDFDVVLNKTESVDLPEVVGKSFNKNNITESVTFSETFLTLLEILRSPTEDPSTQDAAIFAIGLVKAEQLGIQDAPSLQPNLIKTENPTTGDALDSFDVGKPFADTADFVDPAILLFVATKADNYEVSDAGTIYMQNYAGDYFAEDYVESYSGVSSTTF